MAEDKVFFGSVRQLTYSSGLQSLGKPYSMRFVVMHSFPPTAWNILVAARNPDGVDAQAAKERICQDYWQPVHSYLRSLGLGHEDAQDATQQLLASFCTGDWLQRVDAAQGRMRHFFKASARNAAANHFRAQRRHKRGGSQDAMPLDELGDHLLPQTPGYGEESFDRAWAWTVFDRTLDNLMQSYVQRGKQALFEALRPALIAAEDLQPYAEIGSTLGMSESHVKIEVYRLRRSMAVKLREEVASTMPPDATAAEIEAETRHLVKALATPCHD